MKKHLLLLCLVISFIFTLCIAAEAAPVEFVITDWSADKFYSDSSRLSISFNSRIDIYNPKLEMKVNASDEFIKSYEVKAKEIIIDFGEEINSQKEFVLSLKNVRDIYGRIIPETDIMFVSEDEFMLSYTIADSHSIVKTEGLIHNDKLKLIVKAHNFSDSVREIFSAFDLKNNNQLDYIKTLDFKLLPGESQSLETDIALPKTTDNSSVTDVYIWQKDNLKPLFSNNIVK